MAAQALFVEIAKNGVPNAQLSVYVFHFKGVPDIVYNYRDGFKNHLFELIQVFVRNDVSRVNVASFGSVTVVAFRQDTENSFVRHDNRSSVCQIGTKLFCNFF